MKKVKYLIPVIMMLVTINVHATKQVAVDNSQVSTGSTTIKLIGDEVSNYKKITFDLSDSKGGKLIVAASCQNGLAGCSVKSGTMFTIENEAGLVAGDIGVVTFNTGGNESFKITPQNVKLYKNIEDEHEKPALGTVSEGVITYIAPKSNNASLTSLVVSQGELTPGFNADTLNYTVTVPDTLNTIKITATPAAGASYSGSGNKTLAAGENKFEIIVIAEDGTTQRTYTLTVMRGEPAKPSGILKSLTINNIGCVLDPDFKPEKFKYTVEVGEDITDLDFKYETEDPEAKVEITGNENFKDGKNVVTIRVEASDGSEFKEYKINVLKNMEKESKKSKKAVTAVKKKIKWWVILLIVLGLLLIIGLILFILWKKGKLKFKKKDKSNKPDKQDKKKSKLHEALFDDDDDDEEDEITELENTATFNTEDFKEKHPDITDADLEKTKEFDLNDFK